MAGFSLRKLVERPFTAGDAYTLIREYSDIVKKCHPIGDPIPDLTLTIEEAAKKLAAGEAMAQLRDIPVDEINREKKGYRVKLLKEAGYQTMADLAGASAYEIASVHGIGMEGATAIRKDMDDFTEKASQGVKIHLSVDDKNENATNLITAIAKYQQAQQPYEAFRAVYSQDKDIVIQHALNGVMLGKANLLRWALLPRKSKELAETSYLYLSDLKAQDFLSRAEETYTRLTEALDMTADRAWELYAQNPIPFINVIEQIVPGIMSDGSRTYGLPEQLAREIQEEDFFPHGLLCELRNYQTWGVKYILHQEKVLLGDEMGLGKTVQAIAAMVSLRNTGATHFCVVCPASVLSNWCREIRKHSRLRVVKMHGSDRQAALADWIASGGVLVTTYETTAHLQLAETFRYAMLVVDEAHYIKNPETIRSSNVVRISRQADRILFMTGTALENNVSEMVTLMRLLNPAVADSVQGMEALSAAPVFREKIAPVYYRRKREDVLKELPELIEKEEWCTLSEEEEQYYEEAVLRRSYARVRRVSWDIEDLTQSAKAQRMLEIIVDAEKEGRKIIVFSFFLETLQKVSQLLGDRCSPVINGSVSPAQRQKIIDDFDCAPAGTVLVAQIQSGGTGLNIQSASVVILCEPQFKPSIENQAISRAYRMGQTRNVLVYRLLCEETVDEKIMEMLHDKQAIFDAFADKSVAAGQTTELDSQTFGKIIEEEIERIKAKNGGNSI